MPKKRKLVAKTPGLLDSASNSQVMNEERSISEESVVSSITPSITANMPPPTGSRRPFPAANRPPRERKSRIDGNTLPPPTAFADSPSHSPAPLIRSADSTPHERFCNSPALSAHSGDITPAEGPLIDWNDMGLAPGQNNQAGAAAELESETTTRDSSLLQPVKNDCRVLSSSDSSVEQIQTRKTYRRRCLSSSTAASKPFTKGSLGTSKGHPPKKRFRYTNTLNSKLQVSPSVTISSISPPPTESELLPAQSSATAPNLARCPFSHPSAGDLEPSLSMKRGKGRPKKRKTGFQKGHKKLPRTTSSFETIATSDSEAAASGRLSRPSTVDIDESLIPTKRSRGRPRRTASASVAISSIHPHKESEPFSNLTVAARNQSKRKFSRISTDNLGISPSTTKIGGRPKRRCKAKGSRGRPKKTSTPTSGSSSTASTSSELRVVADIHQENPSATIPRDNSKPHKTMTMQSVTATGVISLDSIETMESEDIITNAAIRSAPDCPGPTDHGDQLLHQNNIGTLSYAEINDGFDTFSLGPTNDPKEHLDQDPYAGSQLERPRETLTIPPDLLKRINELMMNSTLTSIGENNTNEPLGVTINIPLAESLYKFQRNLQESSYQFARDIIFASADLKRTRFSGTIYEPSDLFTPLNPNDVNDVILGPNSLIWQVFKRTDVIVLDNCELVSRVQWNNMCQNIAIAKLGKAEAEINGHIVFVTVVDNSVSRRVKDEFLKGIGPVLELHNIQYRTNIGNLPHTQIENLWQSYIKMISNSKSNRVQSPEGDNLIHVAADFSHDINSLVSQMLSAAKEEDLQILELTCYKPSSFRLPHATYLYDFLSHRHVSSSPDHTPENVFPMISGKKLSQLKKIDAVVIDGGELITTHAAHKLSNAINIAKGLGADHLFGSMPILIISGSRKMCTLEHFMVSEDFHRGTSYSFCGEASPLIPLPSYTLPETNDRAFNYLRDLELRELKRCNKEKEDEITQMFGQVAENIRGERHQPGSIGEIHDRIMLIEAPPHVPLSELVARVTKEFTDINLNVTNLTCYSSPSDRLSSNTTNVYDFIQHSDGTRNINYYPASGEIIPFTSIDPRSRVLAETHLLIIDGYEHLSHYAAQMLNVNISVAKKIPPNATTFGSTAVLMLAGLQTPLPDRQNMFVGTELHRDAHFFDFNLMPTSAPHFGLIPHRGQSQSLDRIHHPRGRCAPPVRDTDPDHRGAPRGGQRPPRPRQQSSSPTRASGRAIPPSRQTKRGPDITAIYLNQLDDPESSLSEDDDPRDLDFVDPDRARERGRKPGRPSYSYPSYIKTKWEKRKYTRAKESGTFKAAKGRNSPEIPYKSFGQLGIEECSECQALFFMGEGIKSTPVGGDVQSPPGFLQCCRHGKVKVNPPDIPKVIEELLDKKHKKHKLFMRDVRDYNNYFALAAFHTTQIHFKDKHPYVFKIHGQVHALLYHAPPLNRTENDQQRLRVNQVLYIDPALATIEKEKFPVYRELDKEIKKDINEHLRAENHLYDRFTAMGKIQKQVNREWEANNPGFRAPNVTLVFKNKPGVREKGIVFKPTDGAHPGRVEEPVNDGEIAAVFNVNGRPQNVPLYVMENGRPINLSPDNPYREPLLYPLMYADGLPRWYRQDQHQGPHLTETCNKITIREYYAYILHLRQQKFVQRMLGKLTQQWLIEGWVRVEDADLDFIRRCEYMRVSTRPKLTKFLTTLAEAEGLDLGREIKMPSSFSHSPSNMRKHYMNSIQMVRELGLPDLFVTITMDPHSAEIKDDPNINNWDPSLNPVEVCRLFWKKVDYFIRMVRDEMIFGVCVGMVLVVEFQKRGLPHAHAVLTLAEKIRNGNDVDKFCTTRIPCEEREPELHRLVTTKMVHQTCGPRCQRKNGKCAKGYPMAFREKTTMDDGRGFVAIRRPDDGRKFTLKNTEYTRASIVPYNAYLLKRLACHCNVIPVNSFRQVSYLFKYVFKGGDLARLELSWKPQTRKIQNPIRPQPADLILASTHRSRVATRPPDSPGNNLENTTPLGNNSDNNSTVLEPDSSLNGSPKDILTYDETKFYQLCRYVTAMEACWRLLALPLFYFSHKIVQLSVHLEGENPLVFKKGEAVEVASKTLRDSNLTAYFNLVAESRKLHQEDPRRMLLENIRYSEIPKHFVWNYTSRKWNRRQRTKKPNLGRLTECAPNSGDKFYLRVLLQEVPGCASFQELRTFRGITHTTYQEACKARGLCKDDYAYMRCMREAAVHSSAYALRQLFVLILSHCDVLSPADIYEVHWRQMAEHWLSRFDDNRAKTICLAWIRKRVRDNYGNVDVAIFKDVPDNIEIPLEYNEAEPIPSKEEAAAALARLNLDQRNAAATVLAAVDEWKNNFNGGQYHIPRKHSVFFMEGPAGTGKTTTYQAIYNSLRADNQEVLCMAFTGSAAILLPQGRTCHNALKLPVPLNDDSTSSLEPHFEQWKLLERAALIVVDEVAMAPAMVFSILDSILRRIFNANSIFDPIFAGKVVLFGGDLRQIGPIPSDGQTVAQIHFKNSGAYEKSIKLSLQVNMRTGPDEKYFAEFLRSVGEGKALSRKGLPRGSMVIPSHFVIKDFKLESLINWTFEDNPSVTAERRAILTPYNSDCFKINDQIVSDLPGELHRALSVDTILEDSPKESIFTTAPKDRGDPDDASQEVDAATSKNLIHQDELNMILETGMPPHELGLKKGAIVVLIRNLDVKAGLVNGCRMRIQEVTRDRIQCEIISDFPNLREKIIHLPRIKFQKEIAHTVVMQRTQFPVRLAFAMTINKAQGLTLDKVGVYLPEPVSDHGKIYVAMSRVRRHTDLKMLIIESEDGQGFSDLCGCWYTRNEVMKQLWDMTEPAEQLIGPDERFEPPISHIYAHEFDDPDETIISEGPEDMSYPAAPPGTRLRVSGPVDDDSAPTEEELQEFLRLGISPDETNDSGDEDIDNGVYI